MMKTALIFHLMLLGNAVANGPSLSHRTGTLVIQTTPGATVSVEQLTHQFQFGTAVSSRIMSKAADQATREQYLAVLKDNFNAAVHENAMKWYSTEKIRGDLNYRTADAWLTWCTENGLRMRGHCVFWAVKNHIQDWVKQLSDDELRPALESHATDLLTRYRGKIDEFDVNNEMLHVLNTLARFDLPIKITEFDIKTVDEDAKAKGLETLYRTCFEHPAVEGIFMWGFWADAHWLSTKRWGIEGYTALWDKDWTPMPAAQTYRDLLFNEWWTRHEGVADEQGILEVPAFLGTHRISTGDAHFVIVSLEHAGQRKHVRFLP